MTPRTPIGNPLGTPWIFLGAPKNLRGDPKGPLAPPQRGPLRFLLFLLFFFIFSHYFHVFFARTYHVLRRCVPTRTYRVPTAYLPRTYRVPTVIFSLGGLQRREPIFCVFFCVFAKKNMILIKKGPLGCPRGPLGSPRSPLNDPQGFPGGVHGVPCIGASWGAQRGPWRPLGVPKGLPGVP